SRGNIRGRAAPGPQRVLTRGLDPPPVGQRTEVRARRQQPPRRDLADLGRSGLDTERTRTNCRLPLAAVRVEAILGSRLRLRPPTTPPIRRHDVPRYISYVLRAPPGSSMNSTGVPSGSFTKNIRTPPISKGSWSGSYPASMVRR